MDWPVSGGLRAGRAELKSAPEDFRVSEVLWPESEAGLARTPAVVPGDGEHLCLRLEKSGDNTEYVARELSALAGCRSFDVGFCGLKDRHAVTVQWFSIYRPGQESEDKALMLEIDRRWPVYGAVRHSRKLRRGDHQFNGFEIILRNVTGSRDDLEAGLERLAKQGAPNYFGPQRFGFQGSNLSRAVQLDPSRINRKRGRAGRSASKNVLYFSAARSWLFNQVLAERVQDGTWTAVMSGEPGSGEPTGPLWGDGGTLASGTQEKLERGVVDACPELAKLFQTTRMKPERRALVARPDDFVWEWLDHTTLSIRFVLSPGQYATTVLGDLFELEDLSLSRDNK
ncbi:tRNA pseudouridine(13) synthase TruD [Marinobacter sp. VGCF2001]